MSNNLSPTIRLPITLSTAETEYIGRLILKNANLERKTIEFIIPVYFLRYEPGDFLVFDYLNSHYQIRIISTKPSRLEAYITGIIDDINAYRMPKIDNIEQIESMVLENIKYTILDLPFYLEDTNGSPYLAVYLESAYNQSLYVCIAEENYKKIASLNQRTSIGSLISFDNASDIDISLIDQVSKLLIFCKNFERLVENDWNLALCGEEIIKFQKWQKLDQDLYQLTSLIRGNFLTQEFMYSHKVGEDFILLKPNVNIIPISTELIDKEISFKVASCSPQKFKFQNKAEFLKIT